MKHPRRKDMSDMQPVEDLSVLARRGLLTDAERRRLAMALAGSESLRCAHQLGCDFDDLETDRNGDAVLIERMAARAREGFAFSRLEPKRSVAARLLPWVGVASLLLVSAAAGATLWPYARMLVAPALQPSALASAVAASPSKPQNRRALSLATALATELDLAPQPEEPVHSGAAAASRPNVEPAKRTESQGVINSASAGNMPTDEPNREDMSAARLFGAANTLRRNGALAAARAMYRRLQDSYPTASEAALSYMVVGRLDLRQGAAADALQQFERYLAIAPAGPLAQEALQGRAEAYHQLRMKAEEDMAWRELLQIYPNSVYGQAARKRLGELP